MNSYTLTSDSRRWWWPQATAAALSTAATAAIAAIAILPTTGHATPEQTSPHQLPATTFTHHTNLDPNTPADRPCFMTRARWNIALDGPQPVCGPPPNPAPLERTGVIRTWLQYN